MHLVIIVIIIIYITIAKLGLLFFVLTSSLKCYVK